MSRKARNFKAFFRPKSGDLQKKKKKKGLRQNSKCYFGRNPKFKAFFCPKSGDLQKKKKKKVFAKIQSAISAEIRNLKLFSAQNRVISKKKKKKVFTHGPSRFSPELTQISSHKPESLMPNLQRGGPCLNFAHFTMQFCIAIYNPWHNGPPPLNTPLLLSNEGFQNYQRTNIYGIVKSNH